jgi:hypothetical protein
VLIPFVVSLSNHERNQGSATTAGVPDASCVFLSLRPHRIQSIARWSIA